jgi:hypothetical protein
MFKQPEHEADLSSTQVDAPMLSQVALTSNMRSIYETHVLKPKTPNGVVFDLRHLRLYETALFSWLPTTKN